MITSASEEPSTLSEDRNIEMVKSQMFTSHCVVYFACPEEKLLVPFDFQLQVYLNNISKSVPPSENTVLYTIKTNRLMLFRISKLYTLALNSKPYFTPLIQATTLSAFDS